MTEGTDGTDASPSIEATLGATDSDARPTADEGLAPGATLGRYVIGGLLGRGAVGSVYEAHDPQLDRTVALKVLPGREAVLREAQAMARLSHPNVIVVHDVGRTGDVGYIAMERVEGSTLEGWLRAHPTGDRSRVAAVVAVLMQAGAGLAAAHRAGIVHGDFKPSNCMIDGRDRVFVTDFGLAQAIEGSTSGPDVSSEVYELEPRDLVGTKGSTLHGVGTPAYMAPEQFEGGRATVASDQFSFCVAAYEALYDQRPFAADSLVSLATRVVTGSPTPPPTDSAVPRAVWRVVQRGLARQPSDRWTDLDALLIALRRATRRRRLALGLSLTGFAAMAAAVATVAVDDPAKPCDPTATRLPTIWNDARRASLRATFHAADISERAQTWPLVEAGIDDYITRWSARYSTLCLARDHEEAAGATGATGATDRGIACLTQHINDLDATLDVYAEADADLVRRAPAVLHKLSGPEQCEVTASAQPKPPDDVAQQVADVQDQVDRARALTSAMKLDDAVAVASAAVTAAEATAYEPLICNAVGVAGLAAVESEDAASAIPLVERAYFISLELDDASRTTRLALRRAGIATRLRPDYTEAEQWIRHAESTATSVEDRQAVERAWGALELARERFEAARGRFETALEWAGRSSGRGQPIALRVSLGTALARLHRTSESATQFEIALQAARADLGRRHPTVATVLSNLGALRRQAGDLDGAIAATREALEIYIEALGPEHPKVATAYHNLGSIYGTSNDFARAAENLRAALEIWEPRLGSGHKRVAGAQLNLAQAYQHLGRLDDAIALANRAVSAFEATHGSEHCRVGVALAVLSRFHHHRGELDQARRLVERALPMCASDDVDTFARDRVRFNAARILWATPADRSRAVALAKTALRSLESTGRETDDVRRWLAERDPDPETPTK